MLYPQRSKAGQLEEFLLIACREIGALKSRGDYGIDIKVDIFEDDNTTG